MKEATKDDGTGVTELTHVTLVKNDGGQKIAPKEGPNCTENKSAKAGTEDVTHAKNDEEKTAAPKTKDEDDLIPPKRETTKLEKRKMLGKALEIMTIVSMKNHVYKFGGQIMKQSQGGPIGLSLTGDVADCAMVDWDKKLLKKLKTLGIHPALYERFKDDITILLESLDKGTIFKRDELIIDEVKKTLDEEKDDEIITMEVIRDIANSIDPMIQFTVDTPSSHENKKLPILDIQANLNKEENNRLDFQFYEKPTRNKNVILSDSAIPAKQKRTILTQECLRRLRNTKLELGSEVQNLHLNEFMLKLRRSGYSAKYRLEVLNSAQQAFDKMVKDDKDGIKPLYRSRDWNVEVRKEEKRNRRLNWYKNPKGEDNKFKTVLFVPITKGSVLAKEMAERRGDK